MRLCVYCGSRAGDEPIFAAAARELGTLLAAKGIELVYGGGRVGLMGLLADAVLAAGGRAIGIIPRSLAEREVAHSSLTALHVVDTMHERKALMASLSDGFLALPGGFGTFEEYFEAVTWVQLGIHDKPCVLVNVAGYYDPLLALVEGAERSGFVSAGNRRLVVAAATPALALTATLDAIAAKGAIAPA